MKAQTSAGLSDRLNPELKCPRRMKLVPGVWIVAGIVGLFAGHVAWSRLHSRPKVEGLAKELSAMYVIQKPPAVNHANNLIGVIHTTERGVGVFLEDMTAKSERKICEVSDADYKASVAWLFGWTPDDQTLAYSWDYTLHFLDNDGQEPHGCIRFTNRVQSFAWLSPTNCSYTDEAAWLRHAQLVKGEWQETEAWLLPTTNGAPRSVQAVNTNAVTWQTDNLIWRTDVSSGETKLVYSSLRRQLEGFCYSKENDAYLIVESTNRGRTFFLLQVSDASHRPVVRELAHKPSIQSARWINAGLGYTYLSQTADNNSLIGVTRMDGQEKPVFQASQIANIYCDGRDSHVYALGAKASEPAGVWRCNVDSGAVDCVVSPCAGSHFHYQPAQVRTATYGDRHSARFDLVPPANFSRKKKYPLVIGLGSYQWSPIAHGIYAQCLANSGAYVAFVNYRWNQSRPETVLAHTNNVLAVYNQLAANPNIDTSRVFLFGFSAGTAVVGELVKQYPGRWKGIMLLNPSLLPEPKAGMTHRVLATAGSDEGEEARFPRYREQLAKVGIPMEWHIHEDSQHVVRNQAAMYERTLWMADMVFGK